MIVVAREDRKLRFLLGISLNRTNTRKILLGAGADRAKLILHTGEDRAHTVAYQHKDECREGQQQKHHQGQRHIDRQHQDRRDQQGQHGSCATINAGAKQLAHRAKIIGRAGHQVASVVHAVKALVEA